MKKLTVRSIMQMSLNTDMNFGKVYNRDVLRALVTRRVHCIYMNDFIIN